MASTGLTRAIGREGATVRDKGRCGSLHDSSFLGTLRPRSSIPAITIAHGNLRDLLETKPGATGVKFCMHFKVHSIVVYLDLGRV
jgi:hypothetical protein